MVDKVGAFCSIFFAISVFAYIYVLIRQYHHQTKQIVRLQILLLRCALSIPLYSLFLYISLLIPRSYAAFEILITFVEGMALTSFFALLVVNIGGPGATVSALLKQDAPLQCEKVCGSCCGSCCGCPKDKERFYVNSTWNLFHAWWTRTVLILIAAIGDYSETRGGRIIYIVCSLIACVFLLYAVLSLLNLYENVYEETTNLFGIGKLFVIKSSVTILAVLAVVEQFLSSVGSGYKMPMGNDDGSIQQTTQRAYCALMLIIFDVYSLICLYAYPGKIDPPKVVLYEDYYRCEHLSFCGFACKVFCFWDTWNFLTLTSEEKHKITGTSMSAKLSAA